MRRDGCALVSKMLERSLRVLFTTLDLSQVKQYCLRSWTKVLEGRVSVADFVFAKEVRGRRGSRAGPRGREADPAGGRSLR